MRNRRGLELPLKVARGRWMDPINVQSKLKTLLQNEPQAGKLEKLAAALIGRVMGVSVAVTKSGFQHGGDAGTAGVVKHVQIDTRPIDTRPSMATTTGQFSRLNNDIYFPHYCS